VKQVFLCLPLASWLLLKKGEWVLDTSLIHIGPPMLTAFLASLVEFIEALTIVLAVGAVRGWRGALSGTGLALAVLLGLVLLFGPALAHLPKWAIQLGVGTLMLLFGMRWLRKAILREAGVIPLHDEADAYARELTKLNGRATPMKAWDAVAVSAAFNITMLEGIEVVFIVMAIGSTGNGLLLSSDVGAAVALVIVVALGFALHRPIVMIPENHLKFVAGILLSAFGTFWVGEGMSLQWPGGEFSILKLSAGFFVAAVFAVGLCRRQAQAVPFTWNPK